VITTSVADAKARLSELLRLVGQGETVVIRHRGRPVARLVAPEREMERETRWLELERRGVIRKGPVFPDAALLDDDAPRLASASSLLAALLEDRDADR
jgi:prevent-host-death family protein